MSFCEHITPICCGNYEVRLVRNQEELADYQKIRYEYLLLDFNPEMPLKVKIDYNDGYDEENSQLCVFYTDPITQKRELVGGYILMRFKNAGSFCKSAHEFDLTRLVQKHRSEILETSRVVIRPDHRNGTVLKLLWNGIEEYVAKYGLRFIIGTVSFKGMEPEFYRQALSYLHHNYLMPEEIMVRPFDESGSVDLLSKEEIDRETVKGQLPPILRGYLMQGAEVGEGFFIDRDFKSTDVFVVLDREKKVRYCKLK